MLRLFTLKDWEKGLKPTQIREGRKIDFIGKYLIAGEDVFSGITEDGRGFCCPETGKYIGTKECEFDLMIDVPAQKEAFINIYAYQNEIVIAHNCHGSLRAALDARGSVMQYIGTLKVSYSNPKDMTVEVIKIQ